MLNYRSNEKPTKKSNPAPFLKKAAPPNHHSSTLSPQPGVLHTEKTSLHEKTISSDKTKRKKEEIKPERNPGLSLPEVRGAEGISLRYFSSTYLFSKLTRKPLLAIGPHCSFREGGGGVMRGLFS